MTGDGVPARLQIATATLRRRSRQAGYNLVLLAVIVTVMSIAVATALPSWSTTIRREKEEELIFRGLQYAEGIRVFQRRFGRYPASLEELTTAEPRSLRQAWTDPFSPEGGWQPIRMDPGPAAGGGRGGLVRGVGPDPNAAGQPPGLGGEIGGAPIVGVRSGGKGKAVREFFGSRQIGQWEFTVDLFEGGRPGAGGRGSRRPPPATGPGVSIAGRPVSAGAGPIKIARAEWIGRSFRVESPGLGGDSGLDPSDLGEDALNPQRDEEGTGGPPQGRGRGRGGPPPGRGGRDSG